MFSRPCVRKDSFTSQLAENLRPITINFIAELQVVTQHQQWLKSLTGHSSAVVLFIINLIGLGLGPQTVGILNDLLAGPLGEDAIRYSLLCVTLVNFWAVAHSLRAARTLRADLDSVRAEEAGSSTE